MSLSEDDITAWFAQQRKLDAREFPIGIGDDMAQVHPGGDGDLLLTTDMLLEGVHFDLASASLRQAGYKAMAVSLSDCAAMATIPVAAVFAVGLPSQFGEEELKKLYEGIVSAGDEFDCSLIGGDITKWVNENGLVICGTVLSKPGPVPPIRRNGAKVNDVICVTGSLGGSSEGRHLEFRPRVREALKLVETAKVNAMIDISDGLNLDLRRICRQSGVAGVLEEMKIPMSKDARTERSPLDSALNEGEDFELLFTLSHEQCEKLLKQWAEPVALTVIGQVVEGEGVYLKDANGELKVLEPGGYDHFQRG